MLYWGFLGWRGYFEGMVPVIFHAAGLVSCALSARFWYLLMQKRISAR
jgi:hypothetical protein